MLFTIARNIWKFAWRIWSGFLLLYLIAFLANLATAEDPKKTASVNCGGNSHVQTGVIE
jgi:hypothetical protein